MLSQAPDGACEVPSGIAQSLDPHGGGLGMLRRLARRCARDDGTIVQRGAACRSRRPPEAVLPPFHQPRGYLGRNTGGGGDCGASPPHFPNRPPAARQLSGTVAARGGGGRVEKCW